MIQHEQKEAEATREAVSKQEEEANKQAAEAASIKNEAETELAEALPALEEAVKSLKELDIKDITEVRAFMRPPKGVILTMDAVCVMFGDKGEMKENPETGKKERWYWDTVSFAPEMPPQASCPFHVPCKMRHALEL